MRKNIQLRKLKVLQKNMTRFKKDTKDELIKKILYCYHNYSEDTFWYYDVNMKAIDKIDREKYYAFVDKLEKREYEKPKNYEEKLIEEIHFKRNKYLIEPPITFNEYKNQLSKGGSEKFKKSEYEKCLHSFSLFWIDKNNLYPILGDRTDLKEMYDLLEKVYNSRCFDLLDETNIINLNISQLGPSYAVFVPDKKEIEIKFSELGPTIFHAKYVDRIQGCDAYFEYLYNGIKIRFVDKSEASSRALSFFKRFGLENCFDGLVPEIDFIDIGKIYHNYFRLNFLRFLILPLTCLLAIDVFIDEKTLEVQKNDGLKINIDEQDVNVIAYSNNEIHQPFVFLAPLQDAQSYIKINKNDVGVFSFNIDEQSIFTTKNGICTKIAFHVGLTDFTNSDLLIDKNINDEVIFKFLILMLQYANESVFPGTIYVSNPIEKFTIDLLSKRKIKTIFGDYDSYLSDSEDNSNNVDA